MGFNGLTKKNNPVLNDSMTSLENPFLNDKYKTHFMFCKNHDTFYEEKLMPCECAQQKQNLLFTCRKNKRLKEKLHVKEVERLVLSHYMSV